MRNRLAAVLLGLIAPCPPAPAQQPESPGVVLRSTARLVQVGVTVRDRSGAPVRDLSKDDFTLTENGTPQPIAVFVPESAEQVPVRLPELPPGAVSNRTGVIRGATVLLLDALNTPTAYRDRARPRIAEFLRAVAPLGRIAMYVLRSDLTVVADFTSDSAALASTLRTYRGTRAAQQESVQAQVRLSEIKRWNQSRSPDPLGGDAAALELWALEGEKESALVDSVRLTCAALRAIADRVRGIPGRKNLIWVSTGFPLLYKRQDFSNDFERTVRALNDAAVSVYPIDARGLLALAGGLLPSDGGTMGQLADRTGGRPFRGVEVADAARDLVADAQASYTLAYYPSNHEFDGRFRRIEVRVNRAGVSVRHRSGYYAAPDEDSRPEQAKAAMAAAVRNPLDATGIGLDAWLEPPTGTPAGVAIRLHGGTLPIELRDEAYVCRFAAVFVQTDTAGKQIEGVQDSIEIQLSNEALHRALQGGFEYRKALTIRPGATTLRVAVRSLATGALGSLRIPVKDPIRAH